MNERSESVGNIHYLESHGLRVVPVYEGNTPVKFQVVDSKGKTVAESGSLGEVENFIMSNRKLDRGPTVDAIAEIPTL